jgi:HK97 family phage major capsid protein
MPTTAAELEEKMHDGGDFLDMLSNPTRKTERAEWLKNYALAVNKRDQDLKEQIRVEVQKGLQELFKQNGVTDFEPKRPDLSPIDAHGMPQKLPTYTIYNKKARGAVLDKEFESLGAFLSKEGIWRDGARAALAESRERLQRVQNAFGTDVPSDGGFLVPEVLRANLLKVALETAVVRGRAMVIPMENPRVPFPTIDSTTNVGSVYGGITTGWVAEGQGFTPSSAKFGRVVLDAKKHYAYAEVPNELPQDSVLAFDAFLNQTFPQALAFSEDVVFMTGNGAQEPEGFLTAANSSIVTVAKQSGQATKTLVWENLVAMYARMFPSSLGRGIWLASIDTFPELATMALSVGTGGGPVWLGNFQNPGSEAPPVSILGRPVVFTEKAPSLGAAGDISFVDLSYYLIGDRQMMTAADSQDYKFANDMTAYRFIERVDGRSWLRSAITPANGGNTLSAYVQLQAR